MQAIRSVFEGDTSAAQVPLLLLCEGADISIVIGRMQELIAYISAVTDLKTSPNITSISTSK